MKHSRSTFVFTPELGAKLRILRPGTPTGTELTIMSAITGIPGITHHVSGIIPSETLTELDRTRLLCCRAE